MTSLSYSWRGNFLHYMCQQLANNELLICNRMGVQGTCKSFHLQTKGVPFEVQNTQHLTSRSHTGHKRLKGSFTESVSIWSQNPQRATAFHNNNNNKKNTPKCRNDKNKLAEHENKLNATQLIHLELFSCLCDHQLLFYIVPLWKIFDLFMVTVQQLIMHRLHCHFSSHFPGNVLHPVMAALTL